MHCYSNRYSVVIHGSYRQVCVKFKDFSRTYKDLPDFFKNYKIMKNVDLHNETLLQECYTEIIIILAFENKYKIAVPLFGAAFAAPNKGTTILY